MKKIVYLISFFWFLFLLNFIFFLLNDDYKNFLKSLKYPEKNFRITDDYIAFFDQSKCNCPVCEVCEKCSEIDQVLEINNLEGKKNLKENNLEENIEIKREKILWNTKKEIVYDDYIYKILSLFEEKYVLSKKDYDEYYLIFGITDEYPYKYLTYFGDGIELYFYSNNNYDEILQMFNYLKKDLRFSINNNNIFWEKSFFINKNIDDWYFRINIYTNNILFWLKAKKSYYNDIKKILSKI